MLNEHKKKIDVFPSVPLKEDGTIDFDTACNSAFKISKFNPYQEAINLYHQLDIDAPSKVALIKTLLSIAESRSEGPVHTQSIVINAISASDIPRPPDNLSFPTND
jgi:hypothetical protein